MAIKLPPIPKTPKTIVEEGDRKLTAEEIKGLGYTLPSDWGVERVAGKFNLLPPPDWTPAQVSTAISEGLIDLPNDEFQPSKITTLSGVTIPIQGLLSEFPYEEMVKGLETRLAGEMPVAERLMAERELANLKLQFGGLPDYVVTEGLPLPTKADLDYALMSPAEQQLTYIQEQIRIETQQPDPSKLNFDRIAALKEWEKLTQQEIQTQADIQQILPELEEDISYYFPVFTEEQGVEPEAQQFVQEQRLDELITEIQSLGRTPGAETIIKAIFPGISDEQLNQIFAPQFTGPEEGEPLPIAPEPSDWAGSHVAWVESQIGRKLSFSEVMGTKPIPELGNKKWTMALINSISTGGNLPADIPYVGIEDAAKVFGESLRRLPQNIAVAFLQATQGEGGASVVNRDWADELILKVTKENEEFVKEVAAMFPDSKSMETFATASQNLAFSLLSMGAGLATGGPIAFLPVPGARLAAYTAGTAASGFIAYQMTTYQIMQQYLELLDEDKRERTGKGLTLEEENQAKADFSTKATQYGLWEAIPEALSNLAFIKLLGPLKNVVGKFAPALITRITGIYGSELITETITQKGQAGIEAAVGLREGNISWWEAFKEVAPQTFLLTTIMAGGGTVVIGTANAVQRAKDSLKKEIGESNPLYPQLEQIIEEQLPKVIEEATETLPTREEIPTIQRDISYTWERNGIPAHTALLERIGLTDELQIEKLAGINDFAKLPEDIQAKLRDVYTEARATQPAIPQTEAGMPEAGLQADIFGGAKEVRPAGKGRITQISMEDQLKLEQARKITQALPEGTQARISEIKTLLEQKGRLPVGQGTKAQLQMELAELEAKQSASQMTPEGIASAIEDIQNELGIREMPFHAGAKNAYPEYNTKQLDAQLRTFQDALPDNFVAGMGPGTPKSNLITGDINPIDRIIAQSREAVKQDRQGALTKLLRMIPGVKQILEFERPGLQMTGENEKVLIAHVAATQARADVATKTTISLHKIMKELSNAFGEESLIGGQAKVEFIGTEEQAKNKITGTLKDVADNPQLYKLTDGQRNALASFEARNRALLAYVVDGYDVEIGQWISKKEGAYLPNVDISEDAVQMAGSETRNIASGRGKTRIWPTARDRMAGSTTFEPETNIRKLVGGIDGFKGSAAAGNTFRTVLDGKTRLEVLEETHPALFEKMTALRKRLASLRSSAARLDIKLDNAINKFEKSPVEAVDLEELRADLEPFLERGPRVGLGKEDITKMIAEVRAEIKELKPMWEVANTKPYVFVQQGIFRYFPVEQARFIQEILKTTRNPLLYLLENIRGTAFSGDLSPIIGVQTPLGALFDPIGSLRGFLGAMTKSIQEGDIIRSFRQSKLADDMASDPNIWSEFFSLIGRPPEGTPREFSGGFLHHIPGFAKFNEATFLMVTRQQFNMWKTMTNSLVKHGVPELTAKVVAAEKATEVFPLMSPTKLGQSQARQASLRALPTSYSFIRQPAKMFVDAANGIGNLITLHKPTPKQTLSLRLMITMAGTTLIVSALSAALDAQRRGDDVLKAVLDAINPDPKNGKFCSIIINDKLRIPIGGPYRSMFRAFYPREVEGLPIPIPFVGIGQFIMNRLNPIIGAQVDLLRNRDYYYTQIIKGDTFIERILRGLEYEFENVLPLTVGTIIEDLRRGVPEDIIRDAITQFAGFNIVEYGKVEDTDDLISELGTLKPNLRDDKFSIEPDKYYTTRDLWNDLGDTLKYVNPEDRTVKDGYNPLVVSWNEMQSVFAEMSLIPDTPLYKINANPLSGDTFVQYYQQWLEVKRLNANPKLLEQFKKEHDGKSPEQVYTNYRLGNMTQEEYSLLVEYHNLKSDEDREGFLNKHPGLLEDKRDSWLKSNPSANAELAIWGKADILTMAAYNDYEKLVNNLGIPDSALPKEIPPKEIFETNLKYREAEREYSASSAEAKLIRIDNPDFQSWGEEVYGWSSLEDESIPALRITAKWRKQDDEYETIQYTDEAKQKEERAQYLEANPEYRDDRSRREAYMAGFGDEFIEDYVLYDQTPLGNAKPFFRLVNPEFDAEYIRIYEVDPVDVTLKDRYATDAVRALNEQYDNLRKANGDADTAARKQFRINNPILDAYFVYAEDYAPVNNAYLNIKLSQILEWYKLGKEKDKNVPASSKASSGGGGVPGPVFDTSEFLK